jgi:hypothetical protein
MILISDLLDGDKTRLRIENIYLGNRAEFRKFYLILR